MEIKRNTPKDNYYEEYDYNNSHVDLLNLKYKNAKFFITFGYEQLKELLVKYGLFVAPNPSDVKEK